MLVQLYPISRGYRAPQVISSESGGKATILSPDTDNRRRLVTSCDDTECAVGSNR